MFEKLRPALSRSLRGMRTRLFRFGKNSEGAYAMEFALVAAPFFAIIFGIIETSMVFFKEETLQTAVSNSARLILTGQAQANGMSASDFKAEVCNRVAALIDCSNVSIDVEAFADFSGTPINPVDQTLNFDPTKLQYSPGAAGSIVVVTGYATHSMFTPLFSNYYGKLSNGQLLLKASAAFRNEPQ